MPFGENADMHVRVDVYTCMTFSIKCLLNSWMALCSASGWTAFCYLYAEIKWGESDTQSITGRVWLNKKLHSDNWPVVFTLGSNLVNVLGIVISLQAGRSGRFNPGRNKKFFSYPKFSYCLWGPSNLLLIGTMGSFSGGKEAGAWGLSLISIQCQG